MNSKAMLELLDMWLDTTYNCWVVINGQSMTINIDNINIRLYVYNNHLCVIDRLGSDINYCYNDPLFFDNLSRHIDDRLGVYDV